MNAPSLVPVRVPWVGGVTRVPVRVSGSGSVSLASTVAHAQRGVFGGVVGVVDRGRGVVVGAGDVDGDGGDVAGGPPASVAV